MSVNRKVVNVAFGIMIPLAIALTIADEIATVAYAGWNLRFWLQIAGFAFDLAFTVEFLIRLYDAMESRSLSTYIGRGLGWVDFLSSIPLLVFVSGPFAFGALLGDLSGFAPRGIVGVAKLLKAVRVSRALRLLRVIRIARSIKFADSALTQRHVAFVTATACSMLIFLGAAWLTFSPALGIPNIETLAAASHMEDADRVATASTSDLSRAQIGYRATASLLAVRKGTAIVYRTDADLGAFGPSGYEVLERDDLQIFLDARSWDAAQAGSNLFLIGLSLFVFICITFVYGPYFAIRIADPAIIMRKNLEEPGYLLQVSLKDDPDPDEMQRLSKAFNDIALPALNSAGPSKATSLISGSELDGLLGKGTR
jgi:hypothetical protein